MTEHFIIAGAQRSGTTGVYGLLEQHPDICLATPLRPEPKFFLDPDRVNAGYEEYLSRHFSHWRGQPLLGEKSTSYIERFDVAPRIRELLPEVRLIFVLRDPVMRAYSNWRFSRQNGLEDLSFEEALDAESARLSRYANSSLSVSPFAYMQRGHYVRYLDQWAQYIDRERFIILVSEHLFDDPGHIRGAFETLGVRSNIELAETGRVNASEGASQPLDPKCRERLRSHFAESTAALHERWNVDVSRWT